MYYKIIQDGLIIDACDSWGRLGRHGQIIPCKYEQAQFMLGRLPERVPYRIDWLLPLPENYQVSELFDCIKIEKEEHDTIVDSLNKEEQLAYVEEFIEIEEEPEENISEGENPKDILTYSELATKVRDLTNTCHQLIEQNRLLEDCILEMSQILYK